MNVNKSNALSINNSLVQASNTIIDIAKVYSSSRKTILDNKDYTTLVNLIDYLASIVKREGLRDAIISNQMALLPIFNNNGVIGYIKFGKKRDLESNRVINTITFYNETSKTSIKYNLTLPHGKYAGEGKVYLDNYHLIKYRKDITNLERVMATTLKAG